jgi:hypothetical protein
MVELKLVMIISSDISAVIPNTCKMCFAKPVQRRIVVRGVISSTLDRLLEYFGKKICFWKMSVQRR